MRGQTAFRRKTGKVQEVSDSSNEVILAENSTGSSAESSSSPTSEDAATTVTDIVPSPGSPKSSSSLPYYSISIPRSVFLPLEDTVIPLFFNSYLFLPKDPQINNGFMDLLPQSYSGTQFGSSLHLSLLAVSLFSVAAWTGQRALLHSSQDTFIKALRTTREALQGDIDGNLNEILMSVLLLDLYEVGASFLWSELTYLFGLSRTFLREKTDNFLLGTICVGPLP